MDRTVTFAGIWPRKERDDVNRAWILLAAAALTVGGLHGRSDGGQPAQAGALGLTVSLRGTLVHEGRDYRGIGVNCFSLFYRTLKDPTDTSYDAVFKALASRGIPFARFMCGGFWPRDNALYVKDKAEYFRRLDRVVASAGRHGVGLLPSLFWHVSTVPDLVSEPCDAWGDPKSKTHAFMRTYTREVVTRYRNSSAIWGWEFGNEYNLPADLPNAAKHRPACWPKLGTPKARSIRDDLTHAMIRTAFVEFAREVRRHDPHRIISTGNSIPRASAWHQWKEKSWTGDTPAQQGEMLRGDNPDPCSVISIHVYTDARKRLAAAVKTARAAKKPLFVGEFGVEGAATEATRKSFADLVSLIERSGAALAAVWVYDHPSQKTWNISEIGPRSYQLDLIAAANKRLSAAAKQHRE